VLSESTERVDRREKLFTYQTIPSLQEYLLAAQAEREMSIYRRMNEWAGETVTAAGVRLDCLGCDLQLDVIYEAVMG
jgi:Uma2 family endonuclease